MRDAEISRPFLLQLAHARTAEELGRPGAEEGGKHAAVEHFGDSRFLFGADGAVFGERPVADRSTALDSQPAHAETSILQPASAAELRAALAMRNAASPSSAVHKGARPEASAPARSSTAWSIRLRILPKSCGSGANSSYPE